MSWRNLRTTILAVLAVVLLPLNVRAAEEPGTAEELLRDEWMALYIQGQKAGFAHSRTVRRDADDRALYTTTTFVKISLARGPTAMTISVTDEVTEGRAGRLVAFRQILDQGMARMVTEGEVKGEEMTLTTTAAGTPRSQTVGAPRGLCPWGVEQVSHAMGYEPGTSYSLPVFTTQAPTQDVIATVTVREQEAVQVFEVTKWLYPIDIELSILPGIVTTEWADAEGIVWVARTKMAIFDIEVRKVSKEVALQPSGAVEVMVAGAILPDRPIPRPRSCRALTLLLSPTGAGGVDLDLPSDTHQKVTKRDGALQVVIRMAQGDPAKSYRLQYEGEEYASLLGSTPWLEVDDPLIVQMSKEAVGGETDALKAARLVEAYVGEQIEEKTLGMGFATAVETARQRAGDCTEHAVLAAALARAAGMPSRVVCGLAYGGPVAGGVRRKFYFHMWTEVFVGEWLPIDAALGHHDATHIAIARSALERPGDLTELSAGILRVMGKTRIKVLRTGG